MSRNENGMPVIYNRQQTGHSVIKHAILALCTGLLSLVWTIYLAKSPNHYFHL